MDFNKRIGAIFLFFLMVFVQSFQVATGKRDKVDVTFPTVSSETTLQFDGRYNTTRITTTSAETTEPPTEPGYIPAGSDDDVWSVTFGGTGSDIVRSSYICSNADFIVCGNTSSQDRTLAGSYESGWASTYAFVARFSSNGSLRWIRSIGGNNITVAYDVAELTDGSIVCVGYTLATNLIDSAPVSQNVIDAFIYRYSSTGDILNKYIADGSGYDYFYGVAPTPDGGYVACGSSTSSDGDFNMTSSGAVIMKFNSSNQIVSTVTLNGTSGGAIYDVCVDSNSTVFAACVTVSSDGDFAQFSGIGAGNNDSVILKYSSDLSTLRWYCVIASSGNDHRLGANEAPPAIISMYLGDDLDELVHSIINGEDYHSRRAARVQTGVDVLADFKKDKSDRNRTSPFAFTGNKFEFRALGSSLNIGCPNYMLNTMVAEELRVFYEELKDASDLDAALKKLIKDTFTEHQRIIFNGDNYSEEWVEEAERRGLLNLKSLPEALAHFMDEKNVRLFVTHNICTEQELRARYEIDLETYCKQLNIEALTMVDMANKDITPAVSAYVRELSDTALAKKAVSDSIPVNVEVNLINSLAEKQDRFVELTAELEKENVAAAKIEDNLDKAFAYRNKVFAKMEELRELGDSMEAQTSTDFWPYPSYTELLFGV